jgi:hypothetical protein
MAKQTKCMQPTIAVRPHHKSVAEIHKSLSQNDGKMRLKTDDGSERMSNNTPQKYVRMTPDTDGDGM